METQSEENQKPAAKKGPEKITIHNLGKGTHIFGAAHVHPTGADGKPDTSKQCVCLCPLQELGPKGTSKDSIEMTFEQFKFYADDALKQRVDEREFAVLVDGRDMRPDLARREAAKLAAASAKPTPATESVANVESSVLAEILAESEPKTE
jgi:hypothetical protein